ncbi:hypothetical protein FEM48_Zijuj06G0213100 [Ziziphus jujuba var. spinosa]|uniref:Uncharacterized protein n=1 Tax=Ziziphus jujuba var. spinosa TaxID=714518 RepID=A0A978VBP3_ZIZJJ|nr:hypothetical protein FEM48_Zijuj06G0213100 [Ziziphus jujuba var. spinosa]
MYGDQNGCSFDWEENAAKSEDGFSQTLHNMNPQLPSQHPPLLQAQEGWTSTNATINGQPSFVVEDITLSMEEISNHQAHHHLRHHHHPPQEGDLLSAATAMDMELQHQLALEAVENSYNSNGGNSNNNTHLVSSFEQQSNWVDPQLPESPYPPAPDLLNLFNLPRCSNSSCFQILLPISPSQHNSETHPKFPEFSW